MNLHKFIDFRRNLKPFRKNGLDDFSDRMNFKITSMFFSAGVTFILIRQFMLKPMVCYITTSIGGINLAEYMEYYCFSKGTVPINYDTEFPYDLDTWNIVDLEKTNFYSWILLIYALQMGLFFAPHFFWQMTYKSICGRDLIPILKKANEAAVVEGEERDSKMDFVVKGIERVLLSNREIGPSITQRCRNRLPVFLRPLLPSRRGGNRLYASYMLVKTVYLANVVLQLMVIPRLLQPQKAADNGFVLLYKLLSSNGSETSDRLFPRSAFCHTRLPHFGGLNHVVAQCALPFNLVIECLTLIFLTWCCLLLLAGVLSLVLWFRRLFLPAARLRYVTQHLHMQKMTRWLFRLPSAPQPTKDNNTTVLTFTANFLRIDGLFLVHMIGINAGEIFAEELLHQLWRLYLDRHQSTDLGHPLRAR